MFSAAKATIGTRDGARRDIVVTEGNNPAVGNSTVIFNGCNGSPIQGPATLVQGCLNTAQSTYVNLKSNESLLVNEGQSLILSTDGNGFYILTETTEVPEPGALALLGADLLGLGLTRQRRAI